VQQWADDIDSRQSEDLLRRYRAKKSDKFRIHPKEAVEESAFKAIDDEDDGDLEAARAKWQRLKQDAGRGWRVTAERHLGAIDGVTKTEEKLLAMRREIRNRHEERVPEGELDKKAFLALRYEKFGDLTRAAGQYEDLQKQAAKAGDQTAWLLFAAHKARKLHDKLRELEAKPEREKLIAAELEKARGMQKEALGLVREPLLDAYAICLEIQTLYGGADEEPGVKALVESARQLGKEILPPLLKS
jgi:hypothetical protein